MTSLDSHEFPESSGQPDEQFSIDASEEPGFLRFFRQLPEKPSTTIRFFDHTDYYTCHGVDAIFAAKELFHTEAVIKCMRSGSTRLEYVTISRMNFEAFLRDLLLVRQYRVQMFINHASRANPDWQLSHTGSPGNLFEFEDILFGSSSQSTSALVAAVKIGSDQGQKVVGLAVIDPGARKMFVTEFPDNDTFSALEATLVQIDPKEVLIPAEGPATDANASLSTTRVSAGSAISQIAERAGILVTEVKRSDFSTTDVLRELNRLLKFKKGAQPDAAVLPETKKELAMGSISALVKFLKLSNDEVNFSTYHLTILDSSRWMRLDAAAVKALNVLPAPHEANKNESILGILNKCRTAQGQRLLRQSVKQPLTDVNKIEERLNVVEAFVNDASLRMNVRDDMLRKIPDFQRLKKRFLSKTATLADYYRVYSCLNNLPNLMSALEENAGEHVATLTAMFSQPLQVIYRGMSKLMQMIEFSMDLDRAAAGEYIIKRGMDEDLDETFEEMKRIEGEMKHDWDRVAKDLKLDSKTLKLESNEQIGYFYRLTKKEEKVLRSNPKYKMIDANKAGVRFHSDPLKRLNVDYVEHKKQYDALEAGLIKDFADVAVTYLDSMQAINDVIAELDMLAAFAAAACTAPNIYVRPKILPAEEGVLTLVNARHPCLEQQDGVTYIPNSAEFSKDGKRFWIITGPNMGGKSTYIRSIACCVLMAQLGSFVPCDEAVISVRDGILARVGAGDDVTRGVSTFMAEMLDTAAILRSASEKSLVVIDELGRGTSTYDGFGLAWAISEHIAAKVKSFTLFATHFHELTSLEDEDPSVGNLHVTAMTSKDELTLMYEVRPGVCDQSFGIHVAEMAKFPPEVIEDAKKKLAILEDFSSSVIVGTELAGSSAEAARKRKEVKDEGRKMIAEFMSNLRKMKADGMDPKVAYQEYLKMKEAMLDKKNLYVEDLLVRHGVAL